MTSARVDAPTNEIKSSITAVSVAMGFARSILTGYEHLFNPYEAELTNHLCKIGRKSLRGLNWILGEGVAHLPYSLQQSFFNHAVIPGYDRIIMLRKLMIKQKIEEAIRNGTKQIIFLGGGYDIRGLVTALEHPDVQVFELDRGPTRKCKLEGLKSIPVGIGFDHVKLIDASATSTTMNNLHYIDCDLSTTTLTKVLSNEGFKQEDTTLLIAEGLTMYLDEQSNQQLLSATTALPNPNNEILLSFMSKVQYSTIARTAQTSSKELYQFALSPQEVLSFSAQCGLGISQRFSAADTLIKIDDPHAVYFTNHPEQPREYYYSLRKADLRPYGKIEDVPEIMLEIPKRPIKEYSASAHA